MNKIFIRPVLLLSAFFVFSYGRSSGMEGKSQFAENLPSAAAGQAVGSQALQLAGILSLNLALFTAQAAYSTHVSTWTSILSHGAFNKLFGQAGFMSRFFSSRRMKSDLKVPKRDYRFVFSKKLQNIVDTIELTPLSYRGKDDSYNEADELRRHYLLYGRPGLGKTTYAEQIAAEVGACHYKFSAGLLSNYEGQEGSHLVQFLKSQVMIIASAAKALGKKVIIVFDEIDGLGKRSKDDESDVVDNANVISALNTIMQELPENVIVFATTNFPGHLDEAFSQRFKHVGLSEPNKKERKKILENYLYCMSSEVLVQSEETIEKLVDLTEGFSHRYIANFVNEMATLSKLRRYKTHRSGSKRKVATDDLTFINMLDVQKAYKKVAPLCSQDLLNYEIKCLNWMERFSKVPRILEELEISRIKAHGLSEKISDFAKNIDLIGEVIGKEKKLDFEKSHSNRLTLEEFEDDSNWVLVGGSPYAEHFREPVHIKTQLIIEDGDEKGKEKVSDMYSFEFVNPYQSLTPPWYKRYFSNSVSFGSRVLTSTPAYMAYGSLTTALTMYGLSKTGVLNFTPQLTLK